MSNRARMRGAVRDRPRCRFCGHRIPAGKEVATWDGRPACPRCRDAGKLVRRIGCGHNILPGSPVATMSADDHNPAFMQCPLCSPLSRLNPEQNARGAAMSPGVAAYRSQFFED